MPPQARGETRTEIVVEVETLQPPSHPPTGRGPPLGSVSSQPRPRWCPWAEPAGPQPALRDRRPARRGKDAVISEVGWKGSPEPCLRAALGQVLRGVSADKQMLTEATCSVHTERKPSRLRGRGTASGWNPGLDM